MNALKKQYITISEKLNVESKKALKNILNELSVLGSSIKAIDSAEIETLIQDATQKITVILDGISRTENARVVETQLMSLKAEINQLLDKLEGAGCPEDLFEPSNTAALFASIGAEQFDGNVSACEMLLMNRRVRNRTVV